MSAGTELGMPHDDADTEQGTPPDDADDLLRHVERVSAEEGWRAALSAITRRWDGLVGSRPDVLLAAITSLPGEAIVRVPSLLVAVNYLRHVIRGDDSRRFHDMPFDEHGRDTRDNELVDSLIALTGRAAGHRTAGKLTQAVESAVSARRLLDEAPDHERAGLHHSLPQLLTQWGRTFEVAEVGGVREFEEAWDLAGLTGQPQIARRAAASLAWLHADRGRLNAAEAWVRRARESGEASTRYDAPLHLAAALVATDRLDQEATIRHLEALEPLSRGEYWAAELWVRAWSARSVEEAARLHQRMGAETQRHPAALVRAGTYRRYLAATRAQLAAIRELPAAGPPTATTWTPFDSIMASAAAYRVGRNHDALEHAAPAVVAGEAPRLQIGGLLLTAAARLTLQRKAAAAEAFSTAYALIEEEGLRSSFRILAPEHLDALVELTGLPSVRTTRPGDPGVLRASGPITLGSLTRREREVLVLLASDRSLTQIAAELFISLNTVKGATKNIYRKLGVHSRAEAADLAHRAGFV